MNDTGVFFETVYKDLKRIAEWRLRGFPRGRTLHATILVHETYLRFMSNRTTNSEQLDSDAGSLPVEELPSPQWSNRAAFFAACSEAMRRIIIDHYRRKVAFKRGGQFRRLPVEMGQLSSGSVEYDLLEIEEALQRLEAAFPQKAEVVKLRFFCGMTMSECAAALDISIATAERHWRFARAWIAEFLEKSSSD